MKFTHKRWIAIHEVGHAVAADYYGVLAKVTIDDQTRASVQEVNVDTACCINLAGPLAQAKYQRRSLLGVYLATGAADLDFIYQHARLYVPLGIAEAQLDIWEAVARQLVLERWAAIQTVAERLLERGTLTATDVRGIVAKSLLTRGSALSGMEMTHG